MSEAPSDDKTIGPAAPLLSIIVPTYNRLAFLQEALASVDYRESSDYEVIVVDDVSTDGTWEWLQTWEDGTRCRVLRMDRNGGPGAARNRGAEVAVGRYLAFLDSDDRWFEYSIAILTQVIFQFRFPAVVLHSCIDVRNDKHIEPSVSEISAKQFGDLLDGLAHGGFFTGAAACLIDRRIFLEIGGFAFKRMNAEDHDLLLKMACTGPFVLLKSPPIFAYRRHGASLVSNVELSFRGYRHLLSSERLGFYPGGRRRRSERRIVLTRILRPAILGFFDRGEYSKGFKLYRATFWWNLLEGRFRFLLGAWFHVLGLRSSGP